MSSVYYTKDHEYISVDGDVGVVGISDYAQEQLGDVVFVELPEIGKVIKKGEECAVVESVKAASEIYAPVDGEVVEINESLEGNPVSVNEDAMGAGWFFKVKNIDAAQLDGLMDEKAYADYLMTLS
ncbi:MAG: glycine cleavage system protein GcvH [Methylobacteriaceae bacterium]|jgi:glycine cleavage system H protein|nr:glycine cleavage system protein GcvH [Methylobacteriaceae bacterium]